MSDSLSDTITLITPVDNIREVTLHEPVVDEIIRFNDDVSKFGGPRAMKNLIASMAGIEVATVGQMRARDFTACSKYLSSFLE